MTSKLNLLENLQEEKKVIADMNACKIKMLLTPPTPSQSTQKSQRLPFWIKHLTSLKSFAFQKIQLTPKQSLVKIP